MSRDRRHHYKRFWHPSDEARLTWMKEGNAPWIRIAQALQCSQAEAQAKWDEIKPRTAPDQTEADDAAYVDACMVDGGFAWWSERCIGMTPQHRRKMAVCAPLNRLAMAVA